MDKKDRSISVYVWLVLNLLSFRQVENQSSGLFGSLPIIGNEATCLEFVFPGRKFCNSDKHYEEVVGFFDFWQASICEKKQVMSNLHQMWASVYAKRFDLSWFNRENIEQCRWVWNYLSQSQDTCSHLHPENPSDEYYYSLAVLYYWQPVESDKKLFMMKLRKAWSQNVYRKKQVGRSPLNTYISKDKKEMLDKLSESEEEKLYKTLERIIGRAYKEKSGGV